ncbi:DMT family transporter [Catenovulum sediminis]|uniref:DMT family transporter n=1 Tax=Catenovulum sediminis TaxID=1740262 RepID=UPI00117C7AF5|nr:DMT family transporter [Catenovulum sediminis]
MNILLALIAGGLITLQASINSQLGVILRNTLLATLVAFSVAAFVSAIVLFATHPYIPGKPLVKTIPMYLWFGGGLSAVGVGLFYYLIPKMGAGSMMSVALTGQLLTAVVLSHFGLFGLPQVPITPSRILGGGAMVLGLVLLNR